MRRSDSDLPFLGLCAWALDGAGERLLAAALEAGVRRVHLRTGGGAAFSRILGRVGPRREELFLALECGAGDVGPASIELVLERLACGYLDLLALDWPMGEASIEDALEVIAGLREAGRLRHLGLAGFPACMEERVTRAAGVPFVLAEYHPFVGRRRLLARCRTRGQRLIARTALARGRVDHDPTLLSIAERHAATPAQVALAWLARQDGVVATVRAKDVQHLRACLSATELELSEEEIAEVDALARDEASQRAAAGGAFATGAGRSSPATD